MCSRSHFNPAIALQMKKLKLRKFKWIRKSHKASEHQSNLDGCQIYFFPSVSTSWLKCRSSHLEGFKAFLPVIKGIKHNSVSNLNNCRIEYLDCLSASPFRTIGWTDNCPLDTQILIFIHVKRIYYEPPNWWPRHPTLKYQSSGQRTWPLPLKSVNVL